MFDSVGETILVYKFLSYPDEKHAWPNLTKQILPLFVLLSCSPIMAQSTHHTKFEKSS